MVTDCAPQLANLYLSYHEYSYMRSLLKTSSYLCLAKRFADTVRYIDDLFTLNNTTFNFEMSNIYPPELTLK